MAKVPGEQAAEVSVPRQKRIATQVELASLLVFVLMTVYKTVSQSFSHLFLHPP